MLCQKSARCGRIVLSNLKKCRETPSTLELTTKIIEEQKLTALMVTHSMKQALEVGSRTVMLHQGQVVFDIAGKDREGLEVKDLLGLFEKQRGLEVDDDSLLLG